MNTMACLLVALLSAVQIQIVDAAEPDQWRLILQRYENWALGGEDLKGIKDGVAGLSDKERKLVNNPVQQVQRIVDSVQKQIKRKWLFQATDDLYDTMKRGPDYKELSYLVDHYLPGLSRAYQMKGTPDVVNPHYRSEAIRRLIFRGFDRLHERGFRSPMAMPYKSSHVKERPKGMAIVVDYHLRTAGYAYATFLMRQELAESGRLQRCLETCREVMLHGEKTGDLSGLHQNADGLRVLVNFALPYALAARDEQRLALLKKQFDYSLTKGSDDYDTIKPDGLGYHHRAGYYVGYAGYTASQSAFMAWLLQETDYALSDVTVNNLFHSLATIRLISQKYDMHKSQSGRLKPTSIIPRIMLGYMYLADIKFKQQSQSQRMLARLADSQFMDSGQVWVSFAAHRSENTPGPGLINRFFHVLAEARKIGAESNPAGHWSFPYGPLAVHRREDWMVSQKGHSEYFWTFERSIKDARLDERLENVLGYHDSSASLYIYGQGSPINARASGYFGDGWDWSRIPGTTTRYLPPDDLIKLTRQGGGFNRPFGESKFTGTLTHQNPDGQNQGIFSMVYTEVTPESARPSRQTLRAIKSSFYFDDQIVMLTSDINGGDTDHDVCTTLYQSRLHVSVAPTMANGLAVTEAHHEKVCQSISFEGIEAITLMDPASNGYFIPQKNERVKALTRRGEQLNLNRSGTHKVQGDFASAWLSHGKRPASGDAEYVILVRTTPEKLSAFARDAKRQYKVLKQDRFAHIVRHHQQRMTGYAVTHAGDELLVDEVLIQKVDTPCLIMTQDLEQGRQQISVCNPDMGWTRGKQYRRKGTQRNVPRVPFDPVPMPVKLTVRGLWSLAIEHAEVEIQMDHKADMTTLTVACDDGRSISFQLKPERSI